jgi:hypothetical protein
MLGQGLRVVVAAALAIIAADAAAAGTVIAGRSAQALRCAAYIGMAARLGYDEGYLDERDVETMTWWSVRVLDRWVDLPTEERLAAYRATLVELGPRHNTYRLIVRHADWCVRSFTPHPEERAQAGSAGGFSPGAP